MKRVAVSLLLLIYGVFTTGATLHTHFCMGELVSVSLTETRSGPCEKCGMQEHERDSNCCKDVPNTLKITDDHSAANDVIFNSPDWVLENNVLPGQFDYTLPALASSRIAVFADSGPPGSLGLPRYLRLRVLRI